MLDKTVSRTLPDLAVSKILSLHQPHAKIYIPGNDYHMLCIVNKYNKIINQIYSYRSNNYVLFWKRAILEILQTIQTWKTAQVVGKILEK